MKVLCFIDSLCSGGAQRQLVTLALGLKKRGHDIRFLVYHTEDHFLPFLQTANIPCQVIPPCTYFQRVLAVRKIIRKGWQDVVMAFLEASSFYAELAFIPKPRWGLVVGERLANTGMKKGMGLWLRQFHRFADVVVCNSYTNQLMLDATFQFLKNKLVTIYNTVDFQLFRMSSEEVQSSSLGAAIPFRIVVAGRYDTQKNPMNVAKALLSLQKQLIRPIVVDWFGYIPSDPTVFNQLKLFISENGLLDSFRLHLATHDIAGEFSRSDAVGLFSSFEGLPNVVCEGMACGKPILLSNVCDADNLVQDGINGFLCDPFSPEDIADKIQRLVSLSELECLHMGLESRKIAEHLFDENVVIERYERILKMAANHEAFAVDCCWPPKVPGSAISTLKRWV